MALQETLPLCFLLVLLLHASSHICQSSHLSVLLFPKRTWPLVVSTVTCRLRVPNVVLLALDYLVLILFPLGGQHTSNSVVKRPWSGVSLGSVPSSFRILASAWASASPPFSRPHTPSPPFVLLLSAHHSSLCFRDISRVALCYFHVPFQSTLHSSWNERAITPENFSVTLHCSSHQW